MRDFVSPSGVSAWWFLLNRETIRLRRMVFIFPSPVPMSTSRHPLPKGEEGETFNLFYKKTRRVRVFFELKSGLIF